MKLSKLSLILAVALTFMIGNSYVVLASEIDPEELAAVVSYIQQNVKVVDGKIECNISSITAAIRTNHEGKFTKLIDVEGGEVYLNVEAVAAIQRRMAQTTDSESVGAKVGDLTSGLGIQANVGGASEMLSGLIPILNIAAGLILTLVILGTGFFTSLDMCYIAFPILREKMGSEGANDKPRFISDDAASSVRDASVEGGSKPWIMYLKKRVGTFIGLGIVTVILATGNVAILVQIAVNLVSGIMSVLQGLAG